MILFRHQHIALGCLFAFLYAPANAQIDPPLGRLFFSAAERRQMDIAREHDSLAVLESLGTDLISLDGVVTRSAGTSTIWINGLPRAERLATSPLILSTDRNEAACILVQAGTAPPKKHLIGTRFDRTNGEGNKTHDPGNLISSRHDPACK